MGCSAPVVNDDQVPIEDLMKMKKDMIVKYQTSRATPTEEDIKTMVRYDIDIVEQIEYYNKVLQEKNSSSLKKKIQSIVKAFDKLNEKWNKINNANQEEEELMDS